MVVVLWRSQMQVMIFAAILLGLLVGFYRGGTVQQALIVYKPYYGQQVEIRGRVSEDTALGPNGDQRVQLTAVVIDGRQLPGRVWISSSTQLIIKRGDIVVFRGQLREGFGNLPASMFRAELVRAERIPHGDVAREVRDWFADGARKIIPEPEASLGIGFLVGQRSTLPEDLDNQLRLLGLTHVVVASGYNLTILVRFTRRAFVKKSKYLATLAAALMIASFVLITGFSPSMSRAALVTGLSLLAWYFGRKVHPFVLLPFSAAVTALLNPAFVWGDIGWYLSFASFAGIMILAPLLKHYFFSKQAKLPSVVQILFETSSAQLATLPIIAYVFGQYSLLALPANLLILPLVPLTMLLTFIAGLTGVLLPTVGAPAGWPANALLSYMTSAVDWLAGLPGATGELRFSLLMLAGGYGMIVCLCVFLWRKTKHRFHEDSIIE